MQNVSIFVICELAKDIQLSLYVYFLTIFSFKFCLFNQIYSVHRNWLDFFLEVNLLYILESVV